KLCIEISYVSSFVVQLLGPLRPMREFRLTPHKQKRSSLSTAIARCDPRLSAYDSDHIGHAIDGLHGARRPVGSMKLHVLPQPNVFDPASDRAGYRATNS